MKTKIVGILVCMLLIGVTGTAFADWQEGEPFKMHFPQLPDPNGYDVDWGNWALGDDWKCIETGNVDDIHFWISWFFDDPMTIQFIDVSIWSNVPEGPGGYSIPGQMLWQRMITDFIVAGPWDGNQLWYMPWGEIIPQPHQLYWQINIKEIPDPFKQIEGEIYWLVIKMPFEVPQLVGWKTTKNYFMDHAVWLEPTGTWSMIDGIDFAFVITEHPKIPDLTCNGTLRWDKVKAGSTVTGSFTVSNIGQPGSLLDWEVSSKPVWGNWTFVPASGIGLLAGSSVTISVSVVAPNQKNTPFTGTVEVRNQNNHADNCTIPVSLTTPRSKLSIDPLFINLLQRFFSQFPVLHWILNPR